MAAFLPILMFVVIAAAMSVGMLLGPRLLAPRKNTAVKEMPYESGMNPIHDTRRRFAVRFHLVAIAFLVFDVELLFLFPWAVASRHSGGGEPGQSTAGIDAIVGRFVESRGLVFGEAMVFVALLALGFAYAWRKGVFRWR